MFRALARAVVLERSRGWFAREHSIRIGGPEMLRLTVAWVVVNALLMTPLWLSAAVLPDGSISGGWLAVEAASMVGTLALLPRWPWGVGLAWVAAIAVVLVTLVGVVDLVFQVSLARPLNLFIDLYLVSAVYNLVVGNMGLVATLATLLLLLLVMGLASFGLARLLAPPDVPPGWPRGAPLAWPRKGMAPRLAGLALVAFSALGMTGTTPLIQSRLAAPVGRLVRTQAALLRETREEKRRFADELTSPSSYAGVHGLLSGLEGRDVLLTFIESYGMAVLNDPDFAAVIGPRLDTLAARAGRAGLHLATGTLISPTTGGQSWYAHGTVISGLWLSNQLRYKLMLASDRETMVDDFRHAGYRTAALMPAITMSWPDGVRLGYDQVHTAANITYGGPPLYWVTMPDQFTWSYLHWTVRHGGDGRPQFVGTAMVSSHAPWTPILPMVDWDEIGDGSRFESFRQEGHPPEELWIDIEQLRAQYARSIDYSLRAMTGYVERYLDEGTLLIVMGDHQAAPWVTGATSAAVPVHVFARDRALLKPFLDWGFREGSRPDSNQEPHRMDEFRGWFVHAYSGGGAAPHARPHLQRATQEAP